MFAVDSKIQELLGASKSSSLTHLRVALVANFEAVDRPDEDIDSVHNEEGLPASTAHKQAHNEAKIALNAKKQRLTASTRQRAVEETIQAVTANYIVTISKRHTCERQTCPNFGNPCYNLPLYGHIKLNGEHL